MNTSKKIISLLMCMLMVLTMVPVSVFATEATEIDTIHIEGVPAPVYGQTVKAYYEAIQAKIDNGTITVNDEVYDSANYKYGNLLDDAWNVRDEDDFYLSSTSTESIKEGTYYVAMWFLPDNGHVIPEDVNVLFDGAKSVKIEVEDDGCLDIHAEYEVKATEIDAVNLTYDLDYIDLNTFYNENSVTVRAREALATDTAGIKISYGNCCVSYIDSNGNYYNCTYPSKEIIAEKDYYIRAVLMLEDGYDWPTAAKTDEPSGLKIISNGTDISDTVYIKYRSDLNWIIVYAKIGKPSTEPVISGVSISDSAIMLDKGESHSFIVDVYGNADDKTVTWTVEGAVSTNTTVDSMGKLTIGADETTDEITVKATSNYNSKKFVTAKVKIGTPTEIDTVHIEGVPAPVYGQTIKSYYEAIEAKITDGTITVNDEVYDSTAYKYGNLFDDGWNVRSEADGYLSSTSTDLIKEGAYYVAMWFYPDFGYVIPEDVNVIFDGAKSVKIEVEDDGCLDIRAEYEFEAPAPTEIDTVHIEGLPAPLYGQTVTEYRQNVSDNRNNGTLKINGNAFTSADWHYGNLESDGSAFLDENKNNLDIYGNSTELITAGTYYYCDWLIPTEGYAFADDVTVPVPAGATSVEIERDDEWLGIYVKFEVAAPTEIDTVHIEGVPAPVYGQTIKSYYEAIEAKITDGTITVNDEVYDSTAYKYGNLLDDAWNVRDEDDFYLSSTSTESFKEGTYYVAMWFLPDNGYVIPEDVNVIFDGAKSVKIELEDDGCLDIHAEYEVKCPHTYDNACDAECNLCTETRTAPHTYDDACDAECNNCPATRTPAAHKGGTATCTDKAKCSVCGEAYGSVNKNNHKSITTLKAVAATYKATGLTEGKKCTACGEITVAQQTVAKKVLGKVTGLKTKAVKLSSGTKTTLTLAWTKVADAQKYEVYQQSGKKWKKIGTTSKTTLTVKKLKANKSYKFKVRAIRSDAKGAYSSVFTGKTVPLTPTVTLKSGKKALTASWKTVANITGYEVQASTSKKFTSKTTKKVTIKKAKTTKTTIKKLSKGKKYYVKVRAYKTVGSKKVYSAWSAVKSVKVK